MCNKMRLGKLVVSARETTETKMKCMTTRELFKKLESMYDLTRKEKSKLRTKQNRIDALQK